MSFLEQPAVVAAIFLGVPMDSLRESHWITGVAVWDREQRRIVRMMQALAHELLTTQRLENSQGLSVSQEKKILILKQQVVNVVTWLLSDQELLMENCWSDKSSWRMLHLRQHRYFSTWLENLTAYTPAAEVQHYGRWWLLSHVAHADQQLATDLKLVA